MRISVIILIWLLSIKFRVIFCMSCQKGWHSVPKSVFCYKRPTNKLLTRDSAQRLCRRFNATLIRVQDDDENELITKLLFDRLKLATDVWLDAKLILGAGPEDWIWSDYNQVQYFNWAPRQPNRNGNQHCLEINRQYTGRYEWPAGVWNDIHCSEKRSTVCQRLATVATFPGQHEHDIKVDSESYLQAAVLLSLVPFFCLLVVIAVRALWTKFQLKCVKAAKPAYGFVVTTKDYNTSFDKPVERRNNLTELTHIS